MYDILGRKTSQLINGNRSAGYHKVSWNAKQSSSGIYFVRMDAYGNDDVLIYNNIKKIILIK